MCDVCMHMLGLVCVTEMNLTCEAETMKRARKPRQSGGNTCIVFFLILSCGYYSNFASGQILYIYCTESVIPVALSTACLSQKLQKRNFNKTGEPSGLFDVQRAAEEPKFGFWDLTLISWVQPLFWFDSYCMTYEFPLVETHLPAWICVLTDLVLSNCQGANSE